MSESLHKQFAKDASLLAHMIDVGSDQVLLSSMSEQSYKDASFLDRRIITPDLKWQAVKWTEFELIKLGPSLPPYYIFHIGHVGSTLISRLLDECCDILALREPQILRDLSNVNMSLDKKNAPWPKERYKHRFDQVVSWLSRSFRDDQRVMIKASSFIANMADDLIGPENKSLFLYVHLESYLETILAGEGSQREAQALAAFRRNELVSNFDIEIEPLAQLSLIQQIALGWLSGMMTLTQCANQKEESLIRWQDFNAFLKEPTRELTEIAAHFDIDLPNIDNLIAGPIMNRYSKDPTHAYTPDLRKQLLQQARANFGADIKAGLDWVEALAKQDPIINKIMSFRQ